MSTYDREFDPFGDENDEPDDIPRRTECDRCGAAAHWETKWDAKGEEKHVLCEGASGLRPHVCKPSTDDFEDLTK